MFLLTDRARARAWAKKSANSNASKRNNNDGSVDLPCAHAAAVSAAKQEQRKQQKKQQQQEQQEQRQQHHKCLLPPPRRAPFLASLPSAYRNMPITWPLHDEASAEARWVGGSGCAAFAAEAGAQAEEQRGVARWVAGAARAAEREEKEEDADDEEDDEDGDDGEGTRLPALMAGGLDDWLWAYNRW